MTVTNRRSFLQLMGTGALGVALPESIASLAAMPAVRRTGTIKDVEHIVILTQENRSFDHYFGTLNGVRGFGDPRAVRLPNGRSVWHQPDGSGGELTPFRPTEGMGRTFLPDPPHGWNDTHAAWNGGRHDQWVPAKGPVTMTYATRADLPYHYALADAFTICDAYHCSVMGPTDPNRYHLWTGWVGNDGLGGGPVITNAEAGYDWATFPERLQRAGISWKVYQDSGVGLTGPGYWGWTGDPYIGNYGDNALLYFHQYQNAQPGNPLADRAKSGTEVNVTGSLVDQFRADVAAGKLPQVSWIAAPEAYTEHPNWAPDFGAWYISQFLDVLAAHPEVWRRTVFLLNYDEEGGFFDHVVPPTPPSGPQHGDSTVPLTNEIYPGDVDHRSAPYGLGMRVPLLAISPWSTGGWVNSEVFDHTSVIRFIEARFADEAPGLIEPNITPWRRAVTGDLTSVFDFARADSRPIRLPSTTTDAPPDRRLYPDLAIVPPANPALPVQERGQRPARALPYALEAWSAVGDGTIGLTLANLADPADPVAAGSTAAVLQVRSAAAGQLPRSYTIGAGKRLTRVWAPAADQGYDLELHGPNGFYRRFAGAIDAPTAGLDVVGTASRGGQHYSLTLSNRTAAAVTVRWTSQYDGESGETRMRPGGTAQLTFGIGDSQGWYDLELVTPEHSAWVRRLAGHVENGRSSFTDPAIAAVAVRTA